MKTWGLIDGIWIWKKKANILFQKAEVQIEAAPMFFFQADDMAMCL